jgi:hypothetical protein
MNCEGQLVLAFAAASAFASSTVLEERPLHPFHRYFRTPRSRLRGGIVDGEFVANRVGIDAGEPLGHVQVLSRSTEADLVVILFCPASA